jgi:hypothetical protein
MDLRAFDARASHDDPPADQDARHSLAGAGVGVPCGRVSTPSLLYRDLHPMKPSPDDHVLHQGRELAKNCHSPSLQIGMYSVGHDSTIRLASLQMGLQPSRVGRTRARYGRFSKSSWRRKCSATNAIQVQPAMIAMRWTKPVGAFGSVPCASRTDSTLPPMKEAMISSPTAAE